MNASYKLVWNRKNKLNKKDQALVQIRVTFNRNKKFVSTGVYLKSEEWDPDKQVVVKHRDRIRLNALLRQKQMELESFEMECYRKAEEYSLQKLDIFVKNENSELTFLKYMEDEINNNKGIKYSTHKQHKVCLNVLKEFGKIVNFNDLNYTNIVKFDNFLKEKGLLQTSVRGYHKRLKVYLHKAIGGKYIDRNNDPYINFKVEKGKAKDRKYLSIEELQKLKEKEYSSATLGKVRDMFLFCCYTGLSFSDYEKLQADDYILDQGGDYWIKDTRVKTDEGYSVLILPQALDILKRYRFEMPKMTNQKYNSYLKEVAVIAEVDKALTSHMARHTFATTITLSNGVPIETVSKMLGHNKISTTQIYSKILDDKSELPRGKPRGSSLVRSENTPRIPPFPTDQAVMKSVFLAVREATKKNGLCLLEIGELFLTNS